MQDSEIPRWALDNRRCHVKGHRSAQRDLQEAVRPDSSIREPTDATCRTQAEQHTSSGQVPKSIEQDCYQRDVTWKSSNLNRSKHRKARKYRDSWTALPMATIRRNTGIDMFCPGRNVTRAKPSRRTRTQELNSSEPRRYGCCCYMLVTLVLQLDWSVGRVSTYPIALVPPSQSAVTHDT
jgi:hypothetical protein